MVKVMLRIYLLHLLRFYQAYCTLLIRYCYFTSGVLISFQISRSTGISIATAFIYYCATMSFSTPVTLTHIR